MTDRPILFSAPMVRAILDGRKTQTRRPLHPKSGIVAAHGVYRHGATWMATEYDRRWPLTLPVAIGDRLWVRETFWQACHYPCTLPSGEPEPHEWTRGNQIHYAADGRPLSHPNRSYPEGLSGKRISAPDPYAIWEQRPSIHMPRWASRLTLIVTDVRVQRLRDIRPADILAEGATGYLDFSSTWDTLYGPGSWDSDPWVVATTFSAHHCNIDQMEAAE